MLVINDGTINLLIFKKKNVRVVDLISSFGAGILCADGCNCV